MKKNKVYDIVYSNNHLLGYFNNSVYKNYDFDEKEALFADIKKQIIKKDSNRKLTSLCVGLFMLVVAVVLAVLMIFKVITLGTGQWYNYTFVIVLLVLLWIIFYYIFGLFFYSKLRINIHFKSSKTTNPNSCVMYASSNYYKWINNYIDNLETAGLVIKEKKKNVNIGFALRMPSWKKNIIFNGHIICNVPYFYFIIKKQRIILLPGMVLVIDGKNSDVFSNYELKCINENKTYHLYKNDKLITSFDVTGEFNINFFYFRYEQL